MRLFKRDLVRFATEAEVVREMDRRAIEEYGIPGAVLMENAGAAAAKVALDMLAPGREATIVAGAGNNAGDGFVIARHLANRGVPVRIITATGSDRYAGDAALNLRVAEKMRLRISEWHSCEEARLRHTYLIVDALLGTGLSGELRPPYGAIIECINESNRPVLSIDLPSGLDADNGEVHTAAVKADRTITFALPKKGLFEGEGPSFAGELILADIALPRELYPEGKALTQP